MPVLDTEQSPSTFEGGYRPVVLAGWTRNERWRFKGISPAAAVTYDIVLEGLVLFRTCCAITNFSTFASSYSVPTPCHLNAPGTGSKY